MNRKCCAAALVAAALISSPAAAQDPPRILTPAAPHLWDVSGDIGWFSNKRSNIARIGDARYDVPAASAAVGYYWTPHVRTEFRVATSGEGRTYQQDPIPPFVPGVRFVPPGFREHVDRTTTAGIGVHYQWFDNQWFHPFAGGGVDLARDSRRTVIYPSNETASSTSWAARPFVATGFKWYVHERGFLRSDVKVSFGPRQHLQTTWSAGIGVDLPLVVSAQVPPGPAVWRSFAEKLDVGTRIKVRLHDGRRVSATLVQANADAILIQPRTRVPVPVQPVPYDTIASIEREQPGSVNAAKAAAIGVGAGVATFFGILLIMLATFD